MANPTFYYNRLACSLGVQIALLESGIPHEQVEVDLAGDRTDYRRINPLGTVPALRTDAGVLTETSAIMTWLALTYPQARLLPADPFGFASGLSFLAWLSSTVHIVRRQARFPGRFTVGATGHEDIKQAGISRYLSCLERIDTLLAGHRFVLEGDHPTACDYQLMAYANWCAIDGTSTAHLRNFERWRQDMVQRPAVREALARVGSLLVTQS